LPLSLLEIHVLAHVTIFFVAYLFWFKKPYNALYPIVYNNSEMVEMAALFASVGRVDELFESNSAS